MHRKPLLQLLQDYSVYYPLESGVANQFIDFVKFHENCFFRTQLNGHVTGSAWLVNQAGTHVLLTHHRKLNIWIQLGGHADGEADVLSVARNEAIEESGIECIKALSKSIFSIDIHPIPEREREPAHLHFDATFVFQTTETDNFVVSAESHDLDWVDIAELSQKTREASMLRMAEKWVADYLP